MMRKGAVGMAAKPNCAWDRSMGDFRKSPWRFRPMCGARAVEKEEDE